MQNRIAMRLSLNLVVAAIFLAIASPNAWAQQKPKENAKVLVGVKMAVTDAYSTVYTRMYGGGEPDLFNITSNGPGAGLTYIDAVNVLMTPGRWYQLTIGSGSWKQGHVKFSAPPGYTIYLDDRPTPERSTDLYNGGGGTYLIYKIILRANDESSVLPAGVATMPSVGDIIWSISMGRYANGLPAGAVQWRASDLTSDLLNATSLIYNEPDSPEIQVTHHSDGGILEIETFQFILYVRRNDTPGTGYTIEIYHPYVQRTGSGDGPYTYSESPYRKFIISNSTGSGVGSAIQIEKQEFEGGTKFITWEIRKNTNQWSVKETNGARITRMVSSQTTAGREEIDTVEDSGGGIATKVKRIFKNYAWGQEELFKEIADPDGLALTTTYAYYTTPSASYGRLQSVTRPDGSWEKYEYDEGTFNWGDLVRVYRPWQDGPATAASANLTNCQATLFSYSGWGSVFSDLLPSGVESRILGTTVSKNVTSYSVAGNAPNGEPLQTIVSQNYTSAGAYLATTQVSYRDTASPEYRSRLYSQTNPDGTKVSALRYKAYWWNYGDNNATNLHKWPGNPGADNTWGEYRFAGFSTQVAGSVPVTNWDGQSFDTVYMVPNRSTVTLDVYNAEGRVWNTVTYVFTGASGGTPSFEFLTLQENGWDNGILASKHGQNGEKDQLWLIKGELSGHSFNDGTYVEYSRDDLGRDYLVRKWYIDASGSYAAQGMIYTHKTFDIAGRVLSEKVSSSSDKNANPADAVTNSRQYNLAGLVTSETAEVGAGNFSTSYAYANGGRTVTVTLPGGATKVADSYLDGTPKSITGTGVVPEYYTVTINGDGTITSQKNIGSANSPRWAKTTSDWLGRVIKTEAPAYGGGTVTKQSFYNSSGQLVKTTETGVADTLIAYNAWQQPYRTGLDVNASGSLETASTDRITETDSVFEKDGNGAWWSKATTSAYRTNNNGTPVTASISKTRLNKYDDHGRFFGSYVQSESIVADIFGNEIKKTVTVQRGSSYFANDIRLVTATTHYPDSSSDEVVVSRNGLVQSTQSKQGLMSYSYYDGRGRLIKTTDPRVDTTSTPRIGFVTNSDRTAWTEDSAGNRTTMTYEAGTGRLSAQTNPLGKSARYSYDIMGRAIRTWGEATYPVEYEFNSYGEQIKMRTFRDTAASFAGTAWPYAGYPSAQGDTTTWSYDAATGLLLSKTDAQNRAVTYTYNARGQLATRVWARNVTTTYGYDPKTAEQTSITYSDGTPSIAYTYDRGGLVASVTDGLGGTRTFDHCDCGKVTAEYLPAFYQNRELHWFLDTTNPGTKGRTTGLYFGTQGNGTNEYGFSFGYDGYGRVNSIGGWTYTYTANSNMIASVADPNGWAQYRTYEANRNLLASIQTKFSTVTKSSFAYTHDALGRRTSLTQSGELFASYQGGGLTTTWGYNDRSEVTSSQTNFLGTNTAVLGRNFGYAYDPIGNRITSSRDGASSTYTTNSLNQYTQRTDPGQVVATGLAPANATVTVNSQTATRQGEYFYKSYAVSNGSAPVWSSLNIASDLGGTFARTAFTPQTPEAYTYDNDGNITADGRWTYNWDAENRLTAMETQAGAYTIGTPRQRLEFKYDYLGRRVQKRVLNWTTPGWVVASESRFLYDGWNLLAEFDTTSGFVMKWRFIWGIDLSGNLQDAGGVGGLLWARDDQSGVPMMPAYDGNGNIYGMIDRGSGAIRAAYEYSPYGETLRAGGDEAAKNPYRFSSKYTDNETQFLYYGFRYYSPSLGRFFGRDPIEEKGGLHLYAFCRNNAVNSYDVNGQFQVCYYSYDDAGRNDHGCYDDPNLTEDIESYLGSPSGLDDSNRGLGAFTNAVNNHLNETIDIQNWTADTIAAEREASANRAAVAQGVINGFNAAASALTAGMGTGPVSVDSAPNSSTPATSVPESGVAMLPIGNVYILPAQSTGQPDSTGTDSGVDEVLHARNEVLYNKQQQEAARREANWNVLLNAHTFDAFIGFNELAFAAEFEADVVTTVFSPLSAGLRTGRIVGRAAQYASKAEITATRIVEINRSLGGTTTLTGDASTVIANMSYREGQAAKAATAIRDIAGRHLFNDANKRTAQVVAEELLGRTADPAKIRTVIDKVAQGELRNVEEIAKALEH